MYRILLVEDDTSLGYILKEYLEMHHFHIELVKDGEAAILAFNRLPIDVCILDVMLPKKDGFAVAAEIKKLNETMPVIFLTAKSLKIDKLKGFNLGADEYMVKPVDEEELIARINAVMRQGKIMDRKQTLKRLWGESDYFTRRSMDVFISHLRKYLSADPSIEIRNVHGKGYVLSLKPKA
jgi:DNA-binding response OmpR family regulator